MGSKTKRLAIYSSIIYLVVDIPHFVFIRRGYNFIDNGILAFAEYEPFLFGLFRWLLLISLIFSFNLPKKFSKYYIPSFVGAIILLTSVFENTAILSRGSIVFNLLLFEASGILALIWGGISLKSEHLEKRTNGYNDILGIEMSEKIKDYEDYSE